MQLVQTAMFLLVVASGFFADVAYGAQDPRWNLPISPVLALIALVAARTIYLALPAAGPVSIASLGLLAVGALVPSSLAAWVALSAVSIIGILFDSQRRLAHQLPLALAVTQMWKAVGFKVLATPVVGAEAAILGWLLNLIGFNVVVVDNVIRITADHSLILLAGCSALSDLGVILLGWTAVFMLFRPGVQVPCWRLAVVGGATVVLNLLRLILMAIDQQWYDLVHNGVGASIYDAVLCSLVISAGLHYPETPSVDARQTSRPVPDATALPLKFWHRHGGHALVTAMLVLVAASFSLKWVRYTAADVSGREEAQVRLKRAITADGFKFVANVALTADGAIEGLIFEKAGCDAPLYVSMLGASGGTEQILSQYLDGAPIAFVLDGKVIERWPMLQFVTINAVGVATQVLTWQTPTLHPLVSVSPPPSADGPSGCSWPGNASSNQQRADLTRAD
jgi:hypothetical protein